MAEAHIRGPFPWAQQVGYSQAVVSGGFVFVAGQWACDAQGDLVPGGFRTQARVMFDNLRAVLEAAGTGLEQVIQTRGFLLDRSDFDAYREVRAEFLPEPYPTTLVVCVADFTFPGMLVEVEAVAELPGR